MKRKPRFIDYEVEYHHSDAKGPMYEDEDVHQRNEDKSKFFRKSTSNQNDRKVDFKEPENYDRNQFPE